MATPPESPPTPSQLAWDVINMAAAGAMPDSFWLTDQRIARACQILRITPDEAREVARA